MKFALKLALIGFACTLVMACSNDKKEPVVIKSDGQGRKLPADAKTK